MKTLADLPGRGSAWLAPLGYLLLFLPAFWQVLMYPSRWLLSPAFDGQKNALTLAWYVEHDSGLNYSGFNHPFGYHYMLTDGHVPLGWLLQPLGISGGAAVGVMNVCLLLSVPLAAWLYYRWFRKVGLSAWVAFALGGALILLSPQWVRLNGHYALSYMWAFPAVGLWVEKGRTCQNSWIAVGLALLGAVTYLLHPYLGFLVGVEVFVLTMLTPNAGRWKQKLIWIASGVLLPIGAFKVAMLGTEHIVHPGGRPWGFWFYQSTWDAYLWPSWKGLDEGLREGLGRWPRIRSEGRAFVGWMNVGVVVWAAVQAMRQRRIQHVGLLVLGGMCLLISLGVPFNQWRGFYEYGGLIQEFRTLGRFSWLALFGLLGWAYLSVFKSSFNGWKPAVLAGVILVAAWVESYPERQKVVSSFQPNGGLVAVEDSLFQPFSLKADAVVPYPFVYVGSDHFSPPDIDRPLLVKTMRSGLATGLPTLTNSGSRQSGEVVRILSSVSSPLGAEPELVQALEDSQWLLVVARRENLEKLQAIPRAKFLTSYRDYIFLEIPTSSYLNPELKQRADGMHTLDLNLEWERTHYHFPSDSLLTQPGHYDFLFAHKDCSPNALCGAIWIERQSDHSHAAGKAFTESIGHNSAGYQVNHLVFDLDAADVPALVVYGFDPNYPGPISFLKPNLQFTPKTTPSPPADSIPEAP